MSLFVACLILCLVLAAFVYFGWLRFSFALGLAIGAYLGVLALGISFTLMGTSFAVGAGASMVLHGGSFGRGIVVGMIFGASAGAWFGL